MLGTKFWIGGSFFNPSLNLCIALLQQGIENLAQVSKVYTTTRSFQQWKLVEDLGLEGPSSREWRDLSESLRIIGIKLTRGLDKLI